MNHSNNSDSTPSQNFSILEKSLIFLLISALTAYIYFKVRAKSDSPYSKTYERMVQKRDILFTQDKNLNFDVKKPIIQKIGWGTLVFQKVEHGKTKIFHKDQTKGGQRADEILWSQGSEHWNWKPKDQKLNISHNPGYTKEMIEYIVKKDSHATHIIFSTGWNDVLCFLGKKRNTLAKKDLTVVENTLKEHLKVGKVRIFQTLKACRQYHDLYHGPKPQNDEVIVLILRTPDAAKAYNYLVQHKAHNVNASFHTTLLTLSSLSLSYDPRKKQAVFISIPK